MELVLLLIYLMTGLGVQKGMRGRLPELSLPHRCGERLSARWERLPLPAVLVAAGIIVFGFLASGLSWLMWPVILPLRMLPAHRLGC